MSPKPHRSNAPGLDDTTIADPQDCADCVALGDVCLYHRGWADGWDQASVVVGSLVLGQPGAGAPEVSRAAP
jgi:hypothetical protein